MVEEKEVMEKITQVEEGDECPHPDQEIISLCYC